MNSSLRWVPQSHRIGTVARMLVNKSMPAIRNKYPLPILDGPLPEECPEPLILHDRKVADDPFQYMEDLFDRKTQAFIRSEQRHSQMYGAQIDIKHQKGRVWAELDSKAVVTSREGGFDKGEERIGEWIYFTRVVPGHDPNAIGFYRKKFGEVDLLAEELINPTLLKQQFGYAHCSVGVCRVSQDGKYLAYTLSVEGGDRYICHVRSIESASLFHVIRGNNIISIEFGSNNQFFFTEANDLNRPCRVVMQEIRPGILPPPVEIYRDDDEQYFVDVRKTKDNQFICINSDAKLQGNVLVLPSSYPLVPSSLKAFFTNPPVPVEVCGKETWSWIEHYNGYFIRVTGDMGTNFRLVYCRVEVALKEGLAAKWKELIPHRDDVQIADVDLFNGRLIVYETHFKFERINHIRVINVEKGIDAAAKQLRSEDLVLHFPPLNSITPGLNRNFDQKEISFVHSSVIQPVKDCVFSFDSKITPEQCSVVSPMALYTQRQAEQFTPWDYMWPYSSYRDYVTGHDGTQIPITVYQRKDAFIQEATDFEPRPNTPKPCLVYVYGSYGEVPSMHFQLAPFLWLLRRRWTVVFAHVRGGGELRNWADQGRGPNKINTTLDFVSCCEHLVSAGFTTPDQLVALGVSAGCVPIAAAMNMRGNTLFRAAIMRSPFLDVTNTMIDPNLPLSLVEREDWGDPLNNKEDLERLLRYDPYHNVNDRVTYPALMISACLDDDRVPGWNALKYVAKLRHQRRRKQVDPIANPLFFRVLNEGGHYKWGEMDEICDEITYLSNLLDLEGPGKILNDMDVMTHMSNLTSAGAMDHQEAKQVFLKWDTWEKEKLDFNIKMHQFDWEPNYRKLKAEKQPFFWVPTHEEWDQKMVDEMIIMKEKAAKERAKGTSAQTGATGVPRGKNKLDEEQSNQDQKK